MKTGILKCTVHMHGLSRRAVGAKIAGIELVSSPGEPQAMVFLARPHRGWRAGELNERAKRFSSPGLVVTLRNVSGVRGVLTGLIQIRMSGRTVDAAVQRINDYFDGAPTLTQVIVYGSRALRGDQLPTPEEVCRLFMVMARQIVA